MGFDNTFWRGYKEYDEGKEISEGRKKLSQREKEQKEKEK